VDLPIVVKTDNIGTLFMSENASTGIQTQHVEISYHFICENVKDRIVKVKIVRSVENDSDIFTKNVNRKIYEKHVKKFLVSIDKLGSH
jgi:hypothetical protein